MNRTFFAGQQGSFGSFNIHDTQAPAKREVPLAYRDWAATSFIITHRVKKTFLLDRMQNCVLQGSYPAMFGDVHRVDALTMVPFDLPYAWSETWKFGWLNEKKGPQADKVMQGENHQSPHFGLEGELPNRTFDPTSYIYSTFNFIPYNVWVTNFKNEQELMDGVDMPGMLTRGVSFPISKKSLENISHITSTVKVTEKIVNTIINFATPGFILEKQKPEEGSGYYYKAIRDGQSLHPGDYLEWYFPKFFIKDSPTKYSAGTKSIRDKLLPTNPHTEKWQKEYNYLLPTQYRDDTRFTLLYRKYDPVANKADVKVIAKLINLGPKGDVELLKHMGMRYGVPPPDAEVWEDHKAKWEEAILFKSIDHMEGASLRRRIFARVKQYADYEQSVLIDMNAQF